MKALVFVRKFTKYCFMAALIFALLVSASLWYITTDSFQQLVRRRLIADIERATGGRAELASFHVVPLRFEVEVRDLTIHGREGPGEVPLAHADRMSAIVKLRSILGAKIAFHSLTLRRPVVHVILYPDGSTNEPTPPQTAGNFEQLLAFGIDRLDVEDGELLWQDQPVPLQFTTNDVSATVDYSFLRQRYSGDISIGKADTQLQGLRPVAWAGKASFSVGRSVTDIRSLTLSSERSRLQLSGTISDFRDPVFKGSYDLTLDLAQAGAVARDPKLTSGTLQVKGNGSWSRQTFSSAGSFDLAALGFRDRSISLKNAAAAGKFAVDAQKISLSQVQGRVLGGAFSSEGEITNWQAAETAKGAKRVKEQERGAFRVKTRDVSLRELLASLGPQFYPVNHLTLAGNLSVNADIRWIGAVGNAEISGTVDVSKPERIAKGEIPLTASVRASYGARSGLLRIDDLTANTPASQVRASGGLGLNSPLRFSFVTSDLGEWQPVTAALFPRGMPFAVNGRLAFNGSAAGEFPNIAIGGTLHAEDVETTVHEVKANGGLHWDSINADLQLSPRQLFLRNAMLKEGDSSLRADGVIGLLAWEVGPQSGMHLRVDAQNLDAAQTARLLGLKFAFTGQLNASGDVTGTVAKPEGQGTVTLLEGSFEGHGFDSASAFVQLHNDKLQFHDAKASRGPAQLAGSGAYDFDAHAIQLNVNGTNFDLAEFSPLEKSRVNVAGKFDFSAQASGGVDQPAVNAHLHLRNVMLNDETAGDYLIDATTKGADLRLTGRSDFRNAELLIDGKVHLRDLWPAHVNLHFNRLDVHSFIETYLHGHATGHSVVAGDLVLEGPLRRPDQLRLTGNLSDFYADIERVKLRNDGPLRFRLSGQAFDLDSFHVIGENSDLSGTGSVQLAGERRLNFTAHGTLGLQLLHSYDPDITGSGNLTGEATISGTFDRPTVQGRVQIVNGSVADVNLPSALTDMNGTFLFSQNQISIQELSARTGGGTANFSGHAELAGSQINFDLSATADSVRLRYPPGVSSTANATLRWSGSSVGSLLSGDIMVTKLGVTPGFDFGAYLEKSVEAASLPQTDPVLNNIRLDLHVVTAPELQMQTSVLRLRGEADLRVRGNAAKPVLLGRADVFEGEAYFGGTKYRLERGGVTFSNPAVTTPFLDLEAATRVRDYDITLSMTGPADKPKLNYRSEPPLPTSDIITLLAFGQTSETSAQLQQTNQSVFSSQASSAMLTAALNATLNNRTQRLFGNSSIKIDPQGLETETSPTQTGPAVTIEQQVRDNLTIAYTTDVAQTSQQVIRAEYNVTKNVSIVAIRDQYGVVSFDVRIRRRKR
jgi:translocation and assembly module TamB